MRWFLLFVGATLALMSGAEARMHAGPNMLGVGHRLKAGTVQDGMGTSLIEAYSFRKVRSAYAGPAVKLRRTTGGTSDINFTAGGDFDVGTAAIFCNATTCYVDTVYDQSGNGRHFVQTTLASQPLYVASCTGGQPCMRLDPDDWMPAIGTAVTPATGIMSISVVAKRSAGTAGATVLSPGGGGNISFNDSGTGLMLFNGGIRIGLAAAENAFHAAVGTIAGASSVFQIDGGTAQTGTVTQTTTAQSPVLGSAAGVTLDWAEAIAWDNYTLTATERTALVNNQTAYWMPLPLDTFATPAAAYSLRRLKSTYAGPAIRLRRASDNAEQDINFLSFTGFTGAPIDTAAASAHCAATTCFGAIWYDQSGNARHVAQATLTDQPAFIFNCNGTLPCSRVSLGASAAQGLIVAIAAPVSPVSLNSVAKQTTRGSANCREIYSGLGNELAQDALTDIVYLSNGGASFNAPSATSAWHSHTGVLSGASSVIRVNGAETAGTLAANVGAGNIVVNYGSGGATCDIGEAVYWSGYALTAGERAALQANQKSFWGTP